MQIVIDIPEEAYKLGTLGSYFGCYSMKLHDTILNGTVLPKHGRLIDADKAAEILRDEMCGTGYQSMAMDVVKSDLYTPTILEAWGNEG